jgi:hypothetical protein
MQASMSDVAVEARRAGRSSWVEGLGRFGLLAKGVSYAIVAVIALKVAVGRGGGLEDRQGAIATLADESFGEVLLVLLVVGFASYAVWRFCEAFFDRGGEGDDAKGLGKRAASFGKGALYTGLAIGVVTILVGSGSGGGSEEKKATAWVLDWPGGKWIVIAVGVCVCGAGAFNAYRAVTKKFEDDLEQHKMDENEERVYSVIGVIGHAARGLVFGLIGTFLIKAAVEYDPKEAVGLDGALAKLAAQDYGAVLLGLTAAGLFCYGLFCMVQARYRRV